MNAKPLIPRSNPYQKSVTCPECDAIVCVRKSKKLRRRTMVALALADHAKVSHGRDVFGSAH